MTLEQCVSCNLVTIRKLVLPDSLLEEEVLKCPWRQLSHLSPAPGPDQVILSNISIASVILYFQNLKAIFLQFTKNIFRFSSSKVPLQAISMLSSAMSCSKRFSIGCFKYFRINKAYCFSVILLFQQLCYTYIYRRSKAFSKTGLYVSKPIFFKMLWKEKTNQTKTKGEKI